MRIRLGDTWIGTFIIPTIAFSIYKAREQKKVEGYEYYYDVLVFDYMKISFIWLGKSLEFSFYNKNRGKNE